MIDIELRATNLHWLEEGDPRDDCCVHGSVYLRIGDRIVSDGEADWTVSTAAFRLLGTVTLEQSQNIDDALIPCCGFNMWPVESVSDGLLIPNCNNGIDWEIQHPDQSLVAHVFPDGQTIHTDIHDWSKAVVEFADSINDFFQTAWPKNFYDDESRLGFELFMNLWAKRRAAANLLYASGK